MDNPNPTGSPSGGFISKQTYWTDSRREIKDWFDKQAPHLGELYEAALIILYFDNFPGRIRLVSHAVREIRNRLPDAISGQIISQQLDYKFRLDEIFSVWTSLEIPITPLRSSASPSTSPPGIVQIPEIMFEKIQLLVNDHNETSEKKLDAARRLFEALAPENKKLQIEIKPMILQWLKVTEWFVDNAHEKVEPSKENKDEEIFKRFELFEVTLNALISKQFFKTIKELDEILKDTEPEQIEKAIALLSRAGEHYRYFFGKLGNPTWLRPLQAKGCFRTPPGLVHDVERQTVSFPLWPESRYLARVANAEPEVVLKIIEGIETDNVRIHEDLTDAALNMPAGEAKKLVGRVKKWLASPYHFLMPEKAGRLIAHLAKGGEKQAALTLSRTVLQISEDPREKTSFSKNKYFHAEPRPLFEHYDYQKILAKDFPALLDLAGKEAFALICGLLNVNLILSRKTAPKDYSHLWRPHIGSSNHLYELKDHLVDAVRDSAIFLIKKDPKNFLSVIETLSSFKWDIFSRLGLYILAMFPSLAPEIVRGWLLNETLFDSYDVRSDYIRLAKVGAHYLPENERQIILGWIFKGPDIERFRETRKQLSGKDSDEEAVEKYSKNWKLHRFSWFATILSPANQIEYKQLINEFGEPPVFEFSGVQTSWAKTSTPKTAEELKAMRLEELFDFLETWSPSDAEKDIYRFKEGLSETLSGVIAQDPVKYVEAAQRFEKLDMTYIQAFFQGLSNALREKKSFQWDSIIILMDYVSRQKYESEDESLINRSPLKYVKDQIARLLETGFQAEAPNPFPLSIRRQLWEIIENLLSDPDPLIFKRDSETPIAEALNTVRPLGLHSAMRYGLWIRRYNDSLQSATELAAKGFSEMPELREALKKHLEDGHEAIRSVYGQWFPWIRLLDPQWAKETIPQIFMTEENNTELKRTAWESYIITVEPYNDVFNILNAQYLFATTHLNEELFKREEHGDAEEALARHLMTFFWRGMLSEKDPVWREFWGKAPPKLRSKALSYIGRSFETTKEPVPPDISQRIIKLWEERLRTAQEAPNKEPYLKELASFAWWFICEKFEIQWAFDQLLSVLRITPHIDVAHQVVKEMIPLTEKWPLDCLRVLSFLATDEQDPWAIQMWKEEAKEVLRIALRLQKTEVTALAKNVIDELGRRGNLDFGELLNEEYSS
ncbi:MAG: hypothetical protein V1882_02150 [Candidatus Omnitrophota bacterium]